MAHQQDTIEAAERWEQAVVAEQAQADRLRTTGDGGDHWRPLAHRFSPERRTEERQDDTVDALLELVKPDDMVLDVGGGAGRIALPIAQKCRKVVVVEPSEGMRDRLAEQVKAWRLQNVEAVGARWEEAEVEPADVVICAHVVYTVRDIAQFIAKLRASARRMVAVVLFEEPAMANYFPLWPLVYCEERLSLPAFDELKDVLNEMEIEFETRRLNEWGSRGFADRDGVKQECMARLFISPESDAEQKLEKVLDNVLEDRDGRLHFEWASTHRPWLVTFGPSRKTP
jgi:SAM-dependent methyltransferase